MAFVNVYGSEVNVSTQLVELDVVDEACLAPLQALMPPGVAWPRDPDAELTKTLRALAYEFCRVQARARTLLDELDPRTTVEMLDDWERVFGLPDDCVTPTTLAERRAALQAKMLGFGDPTKAFFLNMAQQLGYTDAAIVTYTSGDMFTCVSPCTAALYEGFWRFVWDLHATSGEVDDVLSCTIEALAPLHTLPRFYFLAGAGWVERVSPIATTLSAVGHNGTRWVACGAAGGFVESTDGITWTEISGVVQPAGDDFYAIVAVPAPFGVSGATGCWVAVGAAGAITRYEEGDPAWVNEVSGTANSLRAVAYGADRVIAVGDGEIIVSDDGGNTWAPIAGAWPDFTGIAYDSVAARWVAVAADVTAWRSDDNGDTWEEIDLDGALVDAGLAVAHAASTWVVVGAPGDSATATSPTADDASWTARTPDVPTASLFAVCATSDLGHFVAVGGSPGPSTIVRTLGGATWDSVDSPTAESLFAIAKHPTAAQLVAVGSGGAIITSGV